MAFEDVRRAGEAGCAVVALSADLTRTLWHNEAADTLLSGKLSPLPRIQQFAGALMRDGEVTTRLPTQSGAGFVSTTIRLRMAVAAAGEEFALLSSLHPMARPDVGAMLAERLLREAGMIGRPAAMIAADGLQAMSASLGPERAADFADAAEEFLTGPIDYLEIADDGRKLAFARLGTGLALVADTGPWTAVQAAAPRAAEPAPATPAEQTGTTGSQPSTTPIGQIVQRWHERLSEKAVTLRHKAAESRDRLRTETMPRQSGTAEPTPSVAVGEGRFEWRVDAAYRFTEVGAELAAAIGADATALHGHDIFDVVERLGLDPSGEIATLLRSRAPWSGRMVDWPIDGSDDRMRIELAALPVYGRGTVFEGIRGFGRIVERVGAERRPEPVAGTGLSGTEADAFASIGAALGGLGETPPVAASSDLPGDVTAFLDALPVAALVQIRGRLAHANRSFFDLSGYADLAALEGAGGLEVLAADDGRLGEAQGCIRLLRQDGEVVRVSCQMQRVTIAGTAILLFTFQRPVPAPADEEAIELRAVLDTATDGILMLEDDGTLRAMNGSAEALFGLSAARCRGYPFTDLIAEDSRAAATAYLAALRDGGMQSILNDGREVLGKVARGAPIPLFITIGKLGAGRGWCVVIRDIGHWKRIEEELVAARRQAEDASLHKSRFLTNISHELRTPLNAIIGFADVMAAESFGPIGNDRYLQYLRDIKHSGHHLLDLVNDLLDISKIEAGKASLKIAPVSAVDIAAEIVSLMQPQAGRARVILRSDLPRGLPHILADARSIRQIALNLLSNAIRFTPAGGQVVVSASVDAKGCFVMRFRDTGIGMSEDEMSEAMTPYSQVSAIARERGDGTGLGLPLTKAMVEANSARFALRSTQGEGTIVEITFPADRVVAQ
ncbi:ATP-binding protein [Aureimonas altamirensis]|uniref:PAS domain-containing sensor histidine kinase n=1 Tax=Aureimonas altamirensis TaxID=370622 RepID=UPI0020375376|nr:ATP-binding protein [Aureimonas altamirensis]MCM2502077.1 ATP-binding protein [Aureimonas altamirensis]